MERSEACGHAGEGVVLEYGVDGEVWRYTSCGLPACNAAGSEWLQAREWEAGERAREVADGEAGTV